MAFKASNVAKVSRNCFDSFTVGITNKSNSSWEPRYWCISFTKASTLDAPISTTALSSVIKCSWSCPHCFPFTVSLSPSSLFMVSTAMYSAPFKRGYIRCLATVVLPTLPEKFMTATFIFSDSYFCPLCRWAFWQCTYRRNLHGHGC